MRAAIDPALASRLKWSQDAVTEADARLQAASRRRSDLVHEALAGGASFQQIADVIGLTKSRVHAITAQTRATA